MNPLYRKMFQQPGMSRQPMGILASSPELANVAAQRQPLRMQQGGSATYMAAIQSLAQQGDVQTLMEIVRGNAPRDVKVAAQEAVNALSSRKEPAQVSTAPTVQTAGSLASPPVMSVRGSGDTISLKAAPPMMSYGGPSEGALQRRAALADAPSKIMEGLKSGIADIKTGLTDATAPKGPVSAGTGKPSYASPAEVRAGINSFIGNTLLGPKLRRQFFAEDIKDFEPNVDARYPNGFDDPSDFDLSRDAFGFEDAGIDVNLVGVTTTPVGPGEAIAGSAITGGGKTTPTQEAAKKDAEKATGKSKKPVGGGRLLDSIYGSTTKTSELTKTLEADIKNVLDAAETGRTEDKAATAAATDRLKKATDVFNTALGTKMAEAKEFSLEDVKDEALKISGVDDSNYDESRKDAFWMGLMRAGLAIAAGESDNALTNIAKGLGVGLEGYGKDIATLNEQEREDRKEVRAISMDLIKTKNAREIALAAAKNDYTFNQQRLAQAAMQGADAAVIAAQNRENTNKLTGLQLQANLNLQLATRKAEDKKLAVDTAYKQWAAEISMLPTEAKQALMFGPVEYDENGKIKLSPLQEKEYKRILEASTTNKTTVTDTLRSITNAAANGQIRGVKLSDDPTTAQVQSSQWFSLYQKEFEDAAKDPLLDQNKVVEAFARDIRGEVPSNSGENKLQPGQTVDISNHPQRDSFMNQKEGVPFKIKGDVVVRKGTTIVAQ